MLDLDISEFFAADGPLATALPGYTPRPAQVELSQAIGQAITDRATLVAEAGTGTGKTWAYLVPAMVAGGKVVISTGTRTLQDQLFARDLPRVQAALGVPVTAALLKGRGNYICHYHLDRLEGDERALKSRSEMAQLRQIQVFAGTSRTGDRADLGKIPEDADIWQRVTSTRENCLGQECPRIRDCFVLKARRNAQDADIVVVNHALFMADLVLREEGVTDLLPEADTVIFDEAHQLPDTATRFLGSSVSTHQLLDFSRALEAAGLAHMRAAAKWTDIARQVETAARELRLTCAPLDKMPGRKATFEAIPNAEVFDAALVGLRQAVETATCALASVAEAHPDLAAAARSGAEIALRLARWATPGRNGADGPEDGSRINDEGWGQDRQSLVDTSDDDTSSSDQPADDGPAMAQALIQGAMATRLFIGEAVRWVELGQHHVRLHSAPLSVAQAFSKFRKPGQAWILTSATLAVQSDFSHYTSQLGLEDARTGRWESPFDYTNQGLLFVPKGMPEPQSANFAERFVEKLMPLLEVSPGGTLVLCTTLRAVDRVAALLADACEDLGHDWPLLKQGEATRGDLLQRFCKLDHPILVGSASFWEGIDLPGDVLTLVAIDKLPFAPPDDPVIEARLRVCRNRGGNPFAEYQLPEAAIALKQGAGRLIRTERDWGVLMVGDARLVEKPYGKRLWRGLPPFSRTREMSEVLGFYKRREESNN
jgi:ATP-dependent DNA helicase DinG